LLSESRQHLLAIGGGRGENLLRGTTCRYAAAELITGRADIQVGSLVHATVTRTDGEKLQLRLP
jgi:hypothetical protein